MNVAMTLDMYATDNHGLYPDALAQVTPKYLKTIPTCPSVGRDTYSAGYSGRTRA